MEKIWVVAWLLMQPMEGSEGYERTSGLAGPYDEHMCEMIRDEIINLAAARSEAHALVATCRKMKPGDDTLLESAKKEPTLGPETTT